MLKVKKPKDKHKIKYKTINTKILKTKNTIIKFKNTIIKFKRSKKAKRERERERDTDPKHY